MRRKYFARPQVWNKFFATELNSFCAKRGIVMSEEAKGVLWTVALLGGPPFGGAKKTVDAKRSNGVALSLTKEQAEKWVEEAWRKDVPTVVLPAPERPPTRLQQFFAWKLEFNFLGMYCDRPDETIAVLAEMRRLDAKLDWAKRILLCQDHSKKMHNETVAEISKAGKNLTVEQVAEAHAYIAKRQRTRKKPKNTE